MKLESYFGNPEDITLIGSLINHDLLELEKLCWYDTLHSDWKMFQIVLRDIPISLPLEKTLYLMKKRYIRKIFNHERSLYILLVHNPESCKTRILYDFTRLKVPSDMYVTISEIRSRRQLLTNCSLTPPSVYEENEPNRPNDNDSVHSLP